MESDQHPDQVDQQFDDYALVSGLYGPGVMACWYVVIASFVLSLVSWRDNSKARFWLSPDFIAMILYPTIAVGHLIIQIANFPPRNNPYLIANLSNAIYSRPQGAVEAAGHFRPVGGDTSSIWEWNPDESSANRKNLYPKIVAMNAALRIMDIFSDLCFMFLVTLGFFFLAGMGTDSGRYSRRLLTATFVIGLAWCWVARVTFLVKTSNDNGADVVIWSAAFRYFTMICTLALAMMAVVIAVGLGFGVAEWYSSLKTAWENKRRHSWAAYCVGHIVGASVFLPFYILLIVGCGFAAYACFQSQLWVPNTGIFISELDQVTTLAGGLITLAFSIRQAWIGRRQVLSSYNLVSESEPADARETLLPQ